MVYLHDTNINDLGNITLNERSQSQNTTMCMITFIWNIQTVGCLCWRRGTGEKWGVTINGYGASFRGE